MPKYDYRCTRCGKELEAEQRMSDPPLTRCPNCGQEALERLVSKTSFTLKGGGWYADGYGGGSSTAKSESTSSPSTDKPAKADAAAKTDKPAESPKPEPAKSEPKKTE